MTIGMMNTVLFERFAATDMFGAEWGNAITRWWWSLGLDSNDCWWWIKFYFSWVILWRDDIINQTHMPLWGENKENERFFVQKIKKSMFLPRVSPLLQCWKLWTKSNAATVSGSLFWRMGRPDKLISEILFSEFNQGTEWSYHLLCPQQGLELSERAESEPLTRGVQQVFRLLPVLS